MKGLEREFAGKRQMCRIDTVKDCLRKRGLGVRRASKENGAG